MRDPERLRAVKQKLRETHQKLFDLKSAEIVSLREALDAETRTVDASRDVFMAARLAFVEATHAVAGARQTLDLVSEAHDAMAILYEADNELEDLTDDNPPAQ